MGDQYGSGGPATFDATRGEGTPTDEIQTDDHPTGRILAETLEARVAEHLA